MAPPMILSYSQALRSVPAQQSVDLALDDIKVVDEEVQASKDLEHLSFFIKLPPGTYRRLHDFYIRVPT